MLEVVRDHFKLSAPALRREITGMHSTLVNVLAAKGIRYSNLRPALVPSSDRHEAGFIFDSRCIESSWYGREIAKTFLPLLDKRTTQSVLCGDLIGNSQRLIFEILQESLVLARSFDFVHGTSLFCVYINNLSDSALQHLSSELTKYPPYVGYIPATFSSRAKTFLSTTLGHMFLKNEGRIIMGHEDDRPNEEDVNMLGYPFDDFGYKVFSVQSMYFGVLLAFKIERAVYTGFEVDTEMSLNAISDRVLPLRDFAINLEEAKHKYLTTEKAGKLKKAGLADLERRDLAEMIRSKIAANYIYNLTYLAEHNVSKFNIMLEVPRSGGGYPTRLVAALEYRPEQKVLRVITLH